MLLYYHGYLDEAMTHLNAVVDGVERHSFAAARAWHVIGRVEKRRGRKSESEAACSKSLAIYESLTGSLSTEGWRPGTISKMAGVMWNT